MTPAERRTQLARLVRAMERKADSFLLETKATTILYELLDGLAASQRLEVIRKETKQKTKSFREELAALLQNKPRFQFLEAMKKLPVRRKYPGE